MQGNFSGAEIEQLVAEAQLGNEESFSQIFHLFYDKIFRYISFKVDPQEAEDVTAEVFMKLVANLARYQLDPTGKASFNAWLFRIAHNTVIDFYRKEREYLALEDAETGEIRFDLPDAEPLPDEVVQKQFESTKIREILAKLSATNREVLELKYLEEFSNAEIAHITGKTEGNIRIILMRALREMRKFFTEKSA